MAAPAPAGSLLRSPARCVIVPIDTAIGQLLAAAQSLGQESERLLPVLAAPDASPAGSDLRLGSMRGAGTAPGPSRIVAWAADADEATKDVLGVTGTVPFESTFRRSLQALDADAFR